MRHAAILCGGSGSRLWPASRRACPKQFLDVFGCGSTLLQLTAERTASALGRESLLAVAHESHRDLIRDQLPWLPEEAILAEPARRGTAPAVLWAARHVADADPEGSLAIIPSDHLVLREANFAKALRDGFEFVEKTGATVALGIRPQTPRTGAMHIQAGEQTYPNGIYKVLTMAGKPDADLARVFFDSGEFLIHTGIIIFRAADMCALFRQLVPDLWELAQTTPPGIRSAEAIDRIEEAYSKARSASIAEAMLDNHPDLHVMEADIGWSDLSTWDALFLASPKDKDRNATRNALVHAPDCSDSIFSSEGDKLIMAAGLCGYIVADSPNALLICPRDREHELRDTIKSLRSRFGDRFI